MREILQSTATNVMVFMTDDTDLKAGKTGLTLTITASKDGGAFASISPTVTERGNGYYNVALTTSHADTLGDLHLLVSGSGAVTQPVPLRVIAINKADSVRGGMTALPNAAPDAAGGLLVTSGGSLAVDTLLGRLDADISTRLAATGVPSNFAALLINASGHITRVTTVDTTTVNSDMRGTDGANTTTPPTTSEIEAALINEGDGQQLIDAIIQVINSDLDVPTLELTAIANAVWASTTRTLTANDNLNDLDAAAFRTAIGLGAANLDTQLGDTKTVADAIAAVTAKLDTALEDDGASGFQFTTLALDNAPGGGGGGGDANAANQITIIDHLTDIKGSGWNSTASLKAIRDNQPSSSGSGAFAIAITVDDGTDPIESATVRFTKGAETWTDTTDASGDAGLSLDAGTYTVSITAPGYGYTPTAEVIVGADSLTYSMTALTPSSGPSQVTGYCYCYDAEGNPEESVTISCRPYQASASQGAAVEATARTADSDVNGLVEFPGLFPGMEYLLQRQASETGQAIARIASGATGTVQLPSMIG